MGNQGGSIIDGLLWLEVTACVCRTREPGYANRQQVTGRVTIGYPREFSRIICFVSTFLYYIPYKIKNKAIQFSIQFYIYIKIIFKQGNPRNGSDEGLYHSGLLGLWSPSIVRYSKEQNISLEYGKMNKVRNPSNPQN
jgi:hypothetical protein